ncbi:histone-lysine n-methyltransferase setmar [Elysia marginata]|uniref:Histone-lysine n-methyltransferase setmar n=1 Tax=Elysia marginata TaxID=1093978 RepID=A0AAV4EIX7_9GAST|nr:histone-lysine n-methyltransferase setmar [Elysia marginata]
MAAALRLGNPSSSCPQSNLAPSDFHLFGPLKRHLGGIAFENEGDLVGELKNWFAQLDLDFFRVGIYSLLSRWKECFDLHGNYAEKYRKSDIFNCASFKCIPLKPFELCTFSCFFSDVPRI